MFSNLGGIFTNKPRQAEATDTRLGIRRHDPEEERRKKKKKDEPDLNMEVTDSAVISIEALQAFLTTFLKSLEKKDVSGKFQTLAHKTDRQQEFDLPPRGKNSGEASHAANAYQNMARAQEKSSLLSIDDQQEAPEISLASSDVRAIHALLGDLKLLREKNAETLTLEKNDSFLASLIAAAAEKKKSLNIN